jgi:hypothetical protein
VRDCGRAKESLVTEGRAGKVGFATEDRGAEVGRATEGRAAEVGRATEGRANETRMFTEGRANETGLPTEDRVVEVGRDCGKESLTEYRAFEVGCATEGCAVETRLIAEFRFAKVCNVFAGSMRCRMIAAMAWAAPLNNREAMRRQCAMPRQKLVEGFALPWADKSSRRQPGLLGGHPQNGAAMCAVMRKATHRGQRRLKGQRSAGTGSGASINEGDWHGRTFRSDIHHR